MQTIQYKFVAVTDNNISKAVRNLNSGEAIKGPLIRVAYFRYLASIHNAVSGAKEYTVTAFPDQGFVMLARK